MDLPFSAFRPGDTQPQSWVEIGGASYGARPDEFGPIGGGPGYARIPAGGDHEAHDARSLLAALERARPGEVVYVRGAVEIDLTDRVLVDELALRLPGGVTLAGERGRDGSPGALICSDEFRTSPLIRADGPDARVTGLRLRGPDPKRRLEFHRRVYYEGEGGEKAYYRFPNSGGIVADADRLEVDNCEVSAWSHSGIYLRGGRGHRVHHCHVHHCQRMGLGYGVCLGPAECVIERCLLCDNKHHVAGTGAPGCSYEASHNLVQSVEYPGGPQAHLLDMHGGEDRQDGTSIAGDHVLIRCNTFASPNMAVCIRGVPREGAEVSGNWFLFAEPPDDSMVERSGRRGYVDCPHHPFAAPQVVAGGNTRTHDNAWGRPPERPVVRP